MKTKLVSVITPSFNQVDFIQETIESVWSQAGNFKLEHIVMDGGSKDGTVELLKRYEKLLKTKKYPVKCKGLSYYWESKKDRGQTHAINKGIKRARGEILAYLNSDDIYTISAINQVCKTFEKSGVDLVHSGLIYVDEQGEEIERRSGKEYHLEKLLDEKCFIYQPTVFWKKEVSDKLGRFDEDLYYVMDYDYWVRAGKSGFRFQLVKNAYLAKFRIQKFSKTNRKGREYSELRRVARKHGSKFYSTMFYTHWRTRTEKLIDRLGLNGKEIIESVAIVKRRIQSRLKS